MLKHLPNAMTCGNLLCGCVGIVAAFNNDLLLCSYLIVIAGILDFFDGFVARLVKAQSAIGKELDSLADMVTFGVLPSIIIYHLILESVPDLVSTWKCYFAFVIAVFSALRLAKFNIDERQTSGFIGLPTPANAFLIASIPVILRQHEEWGPIILNANYLIAFSFIMSFLLVMEVPLFALKFKGFGWKGNEIKFIFLLVSALLLILLNFTSVPLIIALYILLSLFNNTRKTSY
ncbi:CDP-diacylglycerol--serine O-phosphatidyltransferase [Siphonobacter sp. SORGH_AS_0500]|uniref:CDP-diacylglycerol--serine O-phosphatidyltransferase n=1 Tax=Siphonobacter sp. SORGH_AS_0500 TaxID=1864824 RepID=UPI000CB5B6E5|nr:CDP-diacylglycerol--serine O-phosphatidyltransferase [Siphonobacter sp. SORGH_AS_0500]PKK35299.1 CDP-diacylglycerol--serine O-phosphatidyltransferase [Siphonobacter sp. SORGH_AS_0500]